MTQHYIGSKQVLAWPEERDGKPGYAVKYPDGYTSWSPKETFEAAYLPQGHDGSRITEQMVNDFIVSHESTRLGNHTVVLVRLRNGFTLIEESACVDPANYDQAIGEKYALEKAKKHVWNHLGFLLATARNGINVAAPHSTLAPHQQRVIDEKMQLDERLAKLDAFRTTPIFAGLDQDERHRMVVQAEAMQVYSDVLGERIAAFA